MKIKKHLGKRLLASLLAAVSLIPAGIGAPVSAAESTHPIILKEKNPFDGFYSPKQNNGSVASCNANIMECTIDGENYLAYCLNPDRKGSDNINGNVGESGYGVEVHDLSDPETTSALDYNILLAMQGVIAAGGYLGGGDEAAQKLMDPYQPDRQLYHDRFQAYALTKYAMWTLSQGWTTTDWKINPSASYKPQDLEYLYTSLGDIIGWGTNWTKPNDESLYLIPQDDGSGELWQTDGEEKYIEYQVKSGRTGDNRRDVPISAAYTVVPGTLPDGFRLEKMDGTPITGATEIPAAEHFRVAASGNPESVPEGTEIARVTAEIQSYSIKYGVGVYSGGRVQNYALVPENPWKEVSVPVTLEFTPTETEAKFQIKKTDGSGTGLAGAEFEVTSEDGSWSDTVTTPSSGVATVNVPEPGLYYVQETKAPSGGYALDPTRYSVTVEENSTETVTLTIRNNKSTSLKILKLSAQDDSSLAGAVFEVRNIGTGWSTEVVTGNGGLAIVNDIEPGDYQITEKSPPAGYRISENPVQTIKLEADKVGQVIYKNEPDWSVVNLKKTVEGKDEPIANVVFEFRRQDSAETQSFRTDENGEIHAQLVLDWYVVTEVSGPDNIVIDPTPRTVQLLPGETVELSYTNKLKPNLVLLKVDSRDETPLAGAIIEVKYSDGSFVGQGNCGRGPGIYRSDASGRVELSNLPDGASVVVRELEAPEGYLLDDTPHTIQVEAGEEPYLYTLRNVPKPGLYLQKIDSETGDPILGARFQISKPDVPGSAQTYMTNDQGVIFLPEQDVTALIIEEIAAAPGYILNSEPITVQLEPGKRKDIVIKNTSKPGLRILKTDESGKPVDGVTIRVSREDGSVVGEYVTEDGAIFLPNLNAATYVLEEISCPPQFQLNTEKKIVTLEEGKPGQVVFVNKRRPSLEIIKQDSITKSPLAGVTFRISEVDGREIGQFQTDENGRILLTDGIQTGVRYEIQETATLPGYVLDSEPRQITLKAGEDNTIYVENHAKSPLYILKTDKKNGDPIGGVTFRVEKANGEFIAEVTTSSTGYATVPQMEPGYVTVREISVPDGYTLDPIPKTILIEAGKPAVLHFENEPYGNLLIQKVDAQDSAPLSGARFRVETIDGTLIGEDFVTGPDGSVTIPNLRPGTAVKISEITAPAGYEISEPAKEATVKSGETVSVVFRDKKLESLSILKTDPDGKPLAGAVFELRTTDGQLVTTVTSGENGLAIVPDIEGDFIVTEVRSPDGYILDSTPYPVHVEAGKPAQITIENDAVAGLKIIKTVEQTGEPLEGITFRIEKPDGGLIGEYTTNDQGEIFVPLEPQTVVVREVAVPEGIQLDPTPHTVEIKANDVTKLPLKNIRLSEFTIYKTDPDGKPLAGAVFELRTTDGQLVTTVTSGENGLAIVPNLEGDFIVTEVRSPDGYILDPTPRPVHIEAGKPEQITVENDAIAGLKIIKTVEQTGEPLEGVTFRIEKPDGGLIGEYTTNDQGEIFVPLEPQTVVVREVAVPDGIQLDPTPHTVEIKANDVTKLPLKNIQLSEFTIYKTDPDGKPLAGAVFELRTTDGQLVTTVTSGENGLAIVPNLEGDFIVTEVRSPDGYILDPTPHPVHIKAGKPEQITVENNAIAGLKIIKTVEQTGEPLEGVTFRIEKPDGGLIGEYTTNDQGEIFVPLEPQTVVVWEVAVPEGIQLDPTPHTVEIKANDVTKLPLKNERLNGVRIRKVDADTGKGIYGVRIMITDENNDVVGVYTTDQRGYIEIDKELPDGIYYLEEVSAAPGYDLDKVVKRIRIENGKTKVIVWENAREKGQIQILKTSADANPITGQPAGSRLEGAVFEIARADTDLVVGYMVSDYRGVAASEPLPLGRYVVREVTPPPFFRLNDKEFEVELKVQNDVVRVEVQNASAQISTSVKKSGNTVVTPGQQMRYDFSDICNLSNVPLDSFFWHDELPSAVRLDVIHTGTWNQPGLSYSVTYRTNRNSSYRTLASGLLATQSYDLDCSASKLGLAQDEYVTDFRFEFGTAQPGFREQDKPMILVTVLPGLTNGARFANRTDAGGQYSGKWFSSSFTWVTEVSAPPQSYPKTGY